MFEFEDEEWSILEESWHTKKDDPIVQHFVTESTCALTIIRAIRDKKP